MWLGGACVAAVAPAMPPACIRVYASTDIPGGTQKLCVWARCAGATCVRAAGYVGEVCGGGSVREPEATLAPAHPSAPRMHVLCFTFRYTCWLNSCFHLL